MCYSSSFASSSEEESHIVIDILNQERKLQALRDLAQTLASSNIGDCPNGTTLYSDRPSFGGSFEASSR